MLTTKKKVLLGFALALLGVVVSGAAVMAQDNTSNFFKFGLGAKKMISLEDQEKMEEIMTNKDFNAWKELMTEKTNRDELITEEKFNLMVDRFTTKKAIDSAMEKGDYDAWVKAVSNQNADNPILSKINKDNFSKLVEAHKLMKDAQEKMDEARKIKEELGIESGKMGPGFGGDGMMERGSRGGKMKGQFMD